MGTNKYIDLREIIEKGSYLDLMRASRIRFEISNTCRSNEERERLNDEAYILREAANRKPHTQEDIDAFDREVEESRRGWDEMERVWR